MRKYLPYIAIIVIGLAISVFSYTKLDAAVDRKTETAKIVVPTSDIPAYKQILPSDLEFKEILSSEVNEDVITDPQSVIGKQAKLPLYAGWAINKKLIEEKKQFKEKHIVAINIDYARSAGAKPGDVVDVYFVKPTTNDWVTTEWSERVATEVIVIAIEGTETKGGSANSVGMAVLAVDKNATYKLVPGATKENDRYVLAIRQGITEEPADIPLAEDVDKDKDVRGLKNE